MGKFLKKEILLGIGIGFIISAIFVSAFGSKPLTDREIRDRAAQLGMVEKPAAVQGKTDKPAGQETVGQKVYSSKEKANPQPALPPAAKPVPQQAEEAIPQSVTITVTSGMGSERIAGMLKARGAIQDQRAFLRVVSEHNAHQRFRDGTFKIPAGTDMDEIVRIMTGR